MKLYLRCDGCGEVFDDIAIARDHSNNGEVGDACEGDTYVIVTEEEAF